LTLDPPLELIDGDDLTLRQMELGCYWMNIDPDRVLQGKEVDLPHRPPLKHAERFLDLMLDNAGEYEIATMPAWQVDAMLGVVVDHFIRASRAK
jgi:hypothetical protein